MTNLNRARCVWYFQWDLICWDIENMWLPRRCTCSVLGVFIGLCLLNTEVLIKVYQKRERRTWYIYNCLHFSLETVCDRREWPFWLLLMRAESSACNSTHLVRQGIFQRPAPGWVHFKPCLSFSPQCSVAGCQRHILVIIWPWVLNLHVQARGARPESGKTLPGEHSCARAET